jgi:hypothetical protein
VASVVRLLIPSPIRRHHDLRLSRASRAEEARGWSLYLRGTRVSEFAFGTLPGWPFSTYVLLTIGGLALLGIGLLIGGFPVWLSWLTLGADIVFLAGYLRFKDIPPFVFYLLLLLVGLVMV